MIAVTSASFATANVLPDEVVMPCERRIEVSELTRIVVPMTPFRGVNLIFPFDLQDQQTTYSLSFDQIWSFSPAGGTNMVPVYFKSFAGEWGELTDFTIATRHHVFSITLKADPDIRNHCTNVIFDFTEEQLQRIREGERKEHLEALDAEYQKKLASLEEDVNRQALKLVGNLASQRPRNIRIHEDNSLRLSNGDQVEVYVRRMQGFGAFTVITGEVKNDSRVQPLYIQDVKVALTDGRDRRVPVSGHMDIEPRLGINQVASFTFATTQDMPRTGGVMEITTDRGTVEVLW